MQIIIIEVCENALRQKLDGRQVLEIHVTTNYNLTTYSDESFKRSYLINKDKGNG